MITISEIEKKITTALGTAGMDDQNYTSAVKREAIEDIINQEIFVEGLCDEFYITPPSLEVHDGKAYLPSDYLVGDVNGEAIKKISSRNFFDQNYSGKVWTIAQDSNKEFCIFLSFSAEEIFLRYIPKFSITDGSTQIPLKNSWIMAVVYLATRKILEDDQQYDVLESVRRKAVQYYETAYSNAQREEDGEDGFTVQFECDY